MPSPRPPAVPPRAPRPVSAVAAGLLAGLVLALTLVLGVGSPAGAETPTRVAEGLADDGVFVGFGRFEVDEDALIAAVADARDDNLDLVVVVPRDPQPSAKAFARRIQELTEVEVALVFPEDGPVEAYVLDELSGERPRAIEAARSLDDPAAAVAAFAQELTSTTEAERPAIIGQIIRALILFSIVIGVVVALELLISRLRSPVTAT